MEIKEFLQLDEIKQKEFVLNLDDIEFKKFNDQLKRKKAALSMHLSSFRQSERNKSSSITVKEDSDIDIDHILDNPEQPRKRFTQEELQDKMESIKERGLITPITVVKINGKVYLVAGQLRLKAYRELFKETQDEKYKKIKVHFLEEGGAYTQKDFSTDSLIENINRSDMRVIDTANAVKNTIDQNGYSFSELAKILGQSKFFIGMYSKIAEADEEIKVFIDENDINSPTVIYEVLKLELPNSEAIEVLQKYKEKEFNKKDIVELSATKKQKRAPALKEETILDTIYGFKKQFTITKFNKLSEEKRAVAESKIKEIERLQQEILELTQ